MSPRTRLGSVRLLIVTGTALALSVTGAAVAAEGDRVMTPIGGGYETPTLEAFALASAEGASGPTVDLVVVPAAYGDAPRTGPRTSSSPRSAPTRSTPRATR